MEAVRKLERRIETFQHYLVILPSSDKGFLDQKLFADFLVMWNEAFNRFSGKSVCLQAAVLAKQIIRLGLFGH